MLQRVPECGSPVKDLQRTSASITCSRARFTTSKAGRAPTTARVSGWGEGTTYLSRCVMSGGLRLAPGLQN